MISKNTISIAGSLAIAMILIAVSCDQNPGTESSSPVWSKEMANQWYADKGWIVGCNYTPYNAINQIEFWQEDTFDPETIDKELGWAEDLGFNSLRVYLHYLVWARNPTTMKERMEEFLDICESHDIRIMFVLFDDCWNADPKIGKQPEPKPGIHNSGWLQSPGKAVVNDPTQWDRLERYVKDSLTEFRNDKRILLWDLYNEPGNSGQGSKSVPLVKKVFEWAREVDPIQPLSIGIWNGHKELNAIHLSHSDVITFHHYNNADGIH